MEKKKKPFMTIKELKEMVFTILGAFVFIGILVLAGWGIATWGTPKVNRLDYNTKVLSVCDNIEVDESYSPNLGTNLKIAVGYEGNQERIHEWQVELPKSRIPDVESEIDIVICVNENRDTIDSCNYTGGTKYYIQQLNPQIYIIDLESGIAYDTAFFQGELPKFKDCPLTFNNSDNFTGDLPTQDFLNWVDSNIP